ncbi:hypothetical protein WJX74_007142 [Apatococcus lobatus]|uniref:F-box domain-containing protein n=1 Tax=Apatococcus lobatus TaxID=904363 RepID=A0AAW1S067_9CHLO
MAKGAPQLESLCMDALQHVLPKLRVTDLHALALASWPLRKAVKAYVKQHTSDMSGGCEHRQIPCIPARSGDPYPCGFQYTATNILAAVEMSLPGSGCSCR